MNVVVIKSSRYVDTALISNLHENVIDFREIIVSVQRQLKVHSNDLPTRINNGLTIELCPALVRPNQKFYLATGTETPSDTTAIYEINTDQGRHQ